jgi:hypothetical protein
MIFYQIKICVFWLQQFLICLRKRKYWFQHSIALNVCIFVFSHEKTYSNLFILRRSTSIQNSLFSRRLVQLHHPPNNFRRPMFLNGWRYVIIMHRVEISFNGVMCLLNFIKWFQLVQYLLWSSSRQTKRHNVNLISLSFLFKESGLISHSMLAAQTKVLLLLSFYWIQLKLFNDS